MSEKTPLSIIIPAYNEEDRLSYTLDAVLDWSEKTVLFDIELIVVDDGSLDRTREIVRQYMKKDARVRLIEQQHLGTVSAIISGFKNARYSCIGSMEADCSVHPREFEQLFQYADDDTIALGSRILRGDLPPIQGKPLFRRLLSWGMSRFFLLFFECRIYDPQSGFKLYKRDVIFKVLPMLCLGHDGMKSAEILVKAYGLGFSIKEVPVHYCHNQNSRCVPKAKAEAVMIALAALRALMCLWIQSYGDYRRGTLSRLPVRGGAMLRFIYKI